MSKITYTKKTLITLENGTSAEAHAPMIISSSRSTDIPAFYADWFFNRLEKGYSVWTNPFNSLQSYISYKNVKFIVFWSKNPRPLIPYLDILDKRNIGYYIQFTINDYEKDGLESGVPTLSQRIETFKYLVERLGKGRVIWRFDPLILTDNIDMESLLEKISKIGEQIHDYTEKLVFSFADISIYKKVKSNMEAEGIKYKEWNKDTMILLAKELSSLNGKWGLELSTCGESINLTNYGINKNHCIDDRLIVRFGHQHPELMEALGVKIITTSLFEEDDSRYIRLDDGRYAIISQDNRDRGQREVCGCMKSKDIGQYNTCPHLCEYCYANASKAQALANWRTHINNPHAETITGI